MTDERRVFVPTAQVREDLSAVDWNQVDVVTISGSGEPSLAANLDEIVQAIRQLTDKPIHLLTNATLLHLADVRRQVSDIDVIVCKLDAPNDPILHLMNRPVPSVSIESIVEGIVALKAEFAGRLTLQVMIMPLNMDAIADWVPLIRRIQPDEVQLNTPKRPYPVQWYRESRGDHNSSACPFEQRTLRVITEEEARSIERLLREETGANILSIYRT